MNLINYVRVLRRYWISVVAVTLGGILAGGLVPTTTPVYSASASVIFAVPSADTPTELNVGATYAATQVKSYVELARTPLVLDPVIRQLDLGGSASQLAGRITATSPASTAIVSIGVTGPDAVQIAAIANAVARELMVAVDGLAPEGPDGATTIEATLISPASEPTAAISPRGTQNLMLGALVGLVLAVGQAALRAYLRVRVASGRDVDAQGTERPEAGSFPSSADREVDEAYGPQQYRESLAELQRSVDAILDRLERDATAVSPPAET